MPSLPRCEPTLATRIPESKQRSKETLREIPHTTTHGDHHTGKAYAARHSTARCCYASPTLSGHTHSVYHSPFLVSVLALEQPSCAPCHNALLAHTVFVRIGTENHSKIESGRYSADPPMEHAFLPDDGGFECIFCGRTASEHQKASGGSYESTKPAERDLEMEDEDDWDAIQEELRRLTRRCRQARAAARSSQPTHPRASPAWLSRLRKRRPERRPSCSSQK